MDGQLSSSRYHSNDYHRRGRGRGRGGYNANRRGRGHRRDDTRYHPYRRGGGGGGRRQPANRFESKESSDNIDGPGSAVSKQLAAMVAMISDYNSCANASQTMESEDTIKAQEETPKMRGVLRTVVQNIEDLVSLVCNPDNSSLFLDFGRMQGDENYGTTPVDAEHEAGPLATLISSCAATLPLQTPSYAALTLSIEENIPKTGQENDFSGFAERCVIMASRRLADDLDKTCGVVLLSGDPVKTETSNDYVQSFTRAKLLLRYLALLARAGILDNTIMEDQDLDASVNMTSLSLATLLQLLVEAASRAKFMSDGSKVANASYTNVSVLLCALVLSTIPFSVQVLPEDFVMKLLTKISAIIDNYKSPFQPGRGMLSILLKKAQIEESVDDSTIEEDDDDEEGDEDEDSDEGTPVCADSFQDLVRTVRTIVDCYYGEGKLPTKFALISDSPWDGLTLKNVGFESDKSEADDGSSNRIAYQGDKIRISLAKTCHLLHHLLSSPDASIENVQVTLLRPNTDGIIFGRLSIFDPPPDDEDDGEDEDENRTRNPIVDAYVRNFSLVDRFFISDSIRDCLICHKAIVSKTGVERGNARNAAEQLWAVSHLFVNEDDGSKGIECGVVETILSLIVQCHVGSAYPYSMGYIYLCRVLLELAKFQPACIPQSLAFAVSDLFDDFLPSFSPLARENLSHWFAFHLTNTDYQWPHAYWNAWTPYVVNGTKGKRNSRGEFLIKTLEVMASFVSDPKTIASQCLPIQSKLIEYIVPEAGSNNTGDAASMFSSTVGGIENDLKHRIWTKNDEVDDLITFINSDEVSETVLGSRNELDSSSTSDIETLYWRSGMVIRSLLHPIDEKKKMLRERALQSLLLISMDTDDEEDDPKADVITDTIEYLIRYKSLLLAAMAKDIETNDENIDRREETKRNEIEYVIMAEGYLLTQCQKIASYSFTILSSCLECLVSSKVVSPQGVLQWIFGSNGEQYNQEIVRSGWWNFASLASRLAIDDFLKDNKLRLNGDAGSIDMVIDARGGDEDGNSDTDSELRMKQLTDFVVPLLRRASERISSLLQEMKDENTHSHYEADLKEGLKFYVRSATSYVTMALKNRDAVKSTTDLDLVSLHVERWVATCAFDDYVATAII